MQTAEKVTLEDRALIGWHKLPVPVQAQVLGTLGALVGQSSEKWPAEPIERWWPNDDLFALHVWVGPAELLVFFRLEEDRIRIDSMTLKETLERFSNSLIS
jgi:hypothetical protein